MLLYLEKLILSGLQSIFGLDPAFGLVLFGGPALVLVLIQFAKRGQSHIPGVFAIFFTVLAIGHFARAEDMAQFFGGLVTAIDTPTPGRSPVPIIEFMFHVLAGPVENRSIFDEVFVAVFTTYFLFVVVASVQEYRKTGVLIGEFSIASALGKDSSRPLRSLTNELGSGDLANTEQIAEWTKSKGDPTETVFPVSNLRGSDGISFRSTNLVVPREKRNRHMLAVAKTGSGKTSQLILPILYSDCLSSERSTIVIDSKPEMWRYLASMTRKYNPQKNIMLFNPLDTARSLSWNILSKITDDTDCKLIAQSIVMATDNPQAKADSPFFRNNALQILNSIMVGLLNDPNDTLSMPRIHQLVQSGVNNLCDWLEAHPEAIRNTRAFVDLVRAQSQNADTIMSELSMRLSAWDLTAIRATTSSDELDINRLVEEPTLFIVEFRESEVEMLRPMANVIVVELLRYLIKRAESCPGNTLPRPVGLVIDEFASSLGRLPDIHVKLNTLRSRNVSIVAAIQSIAQIKAAYGDDADSVLAGFSTKIFMPALDLQDQEWASKETGQMTIRFQTASTGSNKKLIEWFASRNDSTQEQVQQRAVLTPDEIGRPVDNRCTFFLPNTPVFQGFLTPYYKIPEMNARLMEFKSEDSELKLRAAPIKFEEKAHEPVAASGGGGGGGTPGGPPPGITDTRGWTDDKVLETLTQTKAKLDWENTTGSARKWWEAFENENKHRVALVLRLAEELANRKATITEFFLAYVYSNTDNIQANLHYLDYTRLKKEEEQRRKEAAAKAREAQQQKTDANISSGTRSGSDSSKVAAA